MDLKIVFENASLIVVNKPSGLVVNRSETIKEETLQDQISQYLKLPSGKLGIGERAGIVHRLDRETSGLLVVAKSEKAFLNLQEQFKAREVEKTYVALVHGEVKESTRLIDAPIARTGKFGRFGVAGRRQDGREAETEIVISSKFKVPFEFSQGRQSTIFKKLIDEGGFNKVRQRYLEKQATSYTLVEARPKTGRTHQIRVHLKHIGHPVVSDLIYAPSKLLKFDLLWCPRLFLHAKSLTFRDPSSGKVLSYVADLPKDLASALARLTINN